MSSIFWNKYLAWHCYNTEFKYILFNWICVFPYQIASCHILSCYAMSYHVTSHYTMSWHVTPWHLTSHHATPHNAMPHHVMQFHAMPWHVTSCHIIYVMPCHVMSVMSCCYVMSYVMSHTLQPHCLSVVMLLQFIAHCQSFRGCGHTVSTSFL